MNVAPLRNLVPYFGGLQVLMAIHWLLACSFCAFLFAHIYLATLGHTPFAHFIPMWTGWEEEEIESSPEEASENYTLHAVDDKHPDEKQAATGQ